MKLIYLDLETTGLDPQKNGVIQIAGMIEIDGEVKERFNLRPRPFQTDVIDSRALLVNKTNPEDFQTEKYADPFIVHKKISSMMDRYVSRYDKFDKFTMVGQNPRFDYLFLTEFFNKCGDPYLYSRIGYHLIDLGAIAAVLKLAGKMKTQNLKLESIAQAFSVDFNSHDAEGDIEATRCIFWKIIDTVRSTYPAVN